MRPTVRATAIGLLAAVSLVAFLAPPAAANESMRPAAVWSVRITSTAVNARGHPLLASKVLFVVPAKTAVRVYRVTIDSSKRPWYLVHVRSRPGWIAGWLTKAAPPRPVSLWRAAMASSFGIGDGLVGNRMACGGTLTTTILAVAHRTLRCGSHVRIRVGARTVVARVMDRGPYVSGRSFDLSPAVCRALGACHGVFRIEWQAAP